MTHTTERLASRRIGLWSAFWDVWAKFGLDFLALASASLQRDWRAPLNYSRRSDGDSCHVVIRYVVADRFHVVCFQKSNGWLSCCMFVSARFCGAAVSAPALSTIKCDRPVALVASSGNQGGWFTVFAGALGFCFRSQQQACGICMVCDMIWCLHAHNMMIRAHPVLDPYLACMYRFKFHVHAHDYPCMHHSWVRQGLTYFVCRGAPQRLRRGAA